MSDRRIPWAALAAACGIVVGLPPALGTVEGQTNWSPPHYKVIVTDGGCGGFEAWPDVKRLDDGELLVAFYAGYAHGSPPTDRLPNSGKMALVRSKDNGVTWGPVETIVDSRDDDHDGSLQQLRDGTLICNYFVDIYYRVIDGKEVRANWWKIALRCVRSKDRGKTWSKPIEIQGPWSYVSATSDAVLERDDGVLLMPVYGWEHNGPWRSGVLFSRDQGQTWGDFVLIENEADVYYPKGCDWSTCDVSNYYLNDVWARVLGWDQGLPHKAAHWMNLRAAKMLQMQQRHPDGRMFAPGEYDTYPGAEQMMAWLLADALLALRLDAYQLLGKPADWLGR